MIRSVLRLAVVLSAGLTLSSAGTAHADGLLEEPLARFADPICPGVAGLELASAERMVDLVRANIEGLDVRLGDPERCEPNLLIMFLPDGQEYLQGLASSKPYLFDYLSSAERRELLAATGPVRVWVNSQIVTRDGHPVGTRQNLVELPQAGMWSAHSRIYLPVRRDIVTTIVLFDSGSIDGLDFDQLAAYATIRGLGRTMPELPGGEGRTILTLFDRPGEAPGALTEFDKAYLARLYGRLPNLPASSVLGPPREEPDARDE